ncbi:MAG: hypothetical protein ABI614_27680, partial [Planctomycetota bacterium]
MARTIQDSTDLAEQEAKEQGDQLLGLWNSLLKSLDDPKEIVNVRLRQGKEKEANQLKKILDEGDDLFWQPLDKVAPHTMIGRIRLLERQVMGELKPVDQELGELELKFVIKDAGQSRTIDVTISRTNQLIVSNPDKEVLVRMLDEAIGTGHKLKAVLDQMKIDPPFKEQLEDANKLLDVITKTKNVEQDLLDNLHRAWFVMQHYRSVSRHVQKYSTRIAGEIERIVARLGSSDAGSEEIGELHQRWYHVEAEVRERVTGDLLTSAVTEFKTASDAFRELIKRNLEYRFATQNAEASRRPLDHKKFLDMLVDEMEDKYIELLEGTRAHTANIDAYIKRLMTSLDDDFNTQFYYPTFRKVREASQMWDVQMGQVETTNVLANNRAFAKVSPEATMEFDLPKRDIVIAEAMNGAKAMMDDFGALAQDPTFLAMAQMGSGSPTSSPMAGATGGQSTVRNVLPGLSTDTAESVMGQQGPGGSKFGSAMEALIPDPAIYKFETGTGWEIRPVIQPDGQALVFHFNYMYTTNIREPVRADEKHLGRVKRHFVDT